MTDDDGQNPNMERPEEPRVEEIAEDDERKNPKQVKRRREESDDHDWVYYAAGVSDDDSSECPSDWGDVDSDDGHCGHCYDSVPNQVCKSCHYINGHPPGQEERYNPLKCLFCGKDGDYSKCVTGPFIKYFLEQKEKNEHMKMMLSKGIDTGGSVESGNVPLPN